MTCHLALPTRRALRAVVMLCLTATLGAAALDAQAQAGAATPQPEAAPSSPEAPASATGAPAARPVALPCLKVGALELGCVPGGPFLRGRRRGPRNARPQETVWLQTFYMDRYEVTFAQYQRCAKERRCAPAKPIYPDFSRPRQPMVGVSWYDAVQYCEAHGKHLPTEAQWEKAARGADGRRYPWGARRATCKLAVIKDGRGRSCGVRQRGRYADRGRTFEVGTRPPTQFGLYDMAGNSWEWVADWYSRSYEACGDACRGVDPLGPCAGAAPCRGHRHKVVRGGSWYWPADLATTSYRRYHVPSNKPYHHFGFRCAASQPELQALLESARAADQPARTGAGEPPEGSPSQDEASAGEPGRTSPTTRK